jgi:hypothetical protein
VRDAVGGDLQPLAANAAAVSDPDAFAVAVARCGVASIWIGLLQGAIGVEDVQVLTPSSSTDQVPTMVLGGVLRVVASRQPKRSVAASSGVSSRSVVFKREVYRSIRWGSKVVGMLCVRRRLRVICAALMGASTIMRNLIRVRAKSQVLTNVYED